MPLYNIWLHEVQISRNPVTLGQRQSNLYLYENVDLSHVYHQTKFERNPFMNVRTQAKFKHILFHALK